MTLTTWEPAVPPKLPPHVKQVRNSTGRPYLYLMRYRGTDKAEKPIRLPDDPRSPEFWSAYAALMNLAAPKTNPNSVSALIAAWHASPEWGQLADKTKIDWLRYSGRIQAAWGDLEVRGIEPRHVLTLRDAYAETPASANNLIRCLTALMAWAVPRGYRSDNPCREIKMLKGGDGWQPWPWDAIEAASKTLPVRLWRATALALYTGQRQGDCLAMRWDHVAHGLIAVKQDKTGKRLMIPVHRELQAVLDGIEKTAVTILTTLDGVPWTESGFRATWAKHKPPEVVFHGLRKSAVVTLLECGCSEAEVAAVTGQSLEMVAHYGKQVNQLKLARAAMARWERNEEQTRIGNRIGNTGRTRAKPSV